MVTRSLDAASLTPLPPPHTPGLFQGARHTECLRVILWCTEPITDGGNRFSGSRTRQTAGFDVDGDEVHYPTRPVDKDKAEAELVVNIKKATNPDESAPKQKHVRSASYNSMCPCRTHAWALQNVLYTPGTTTPQYPSGQVFECSLSLRMKCKPSKR